MCDVPELERGPAMTWNDFPNLAHRPHAPAKGRGRLQRQVRRVLIVHGPQFTSRELYAWAYPRRKGRELSSWDRWKAKRLCAQYCDPVERVAPNGPWLWRLRSETSPVLPGEDKK
jgi:hypothetical protein